MILKQLKIWLILQLMFTFMLQGCLGVTEFRRGNIYDSRVFAFLQDIRWGEYEKAQSFINMREGKPRKLNLEYLKNIRVTKLDKIKEMHTQKDEEEVISEMKSVYEIEYYVVSVNVVKTLRYEQLWWYDAELDTWFLDNDLPDFGG